MPVFYKAIFGRKRGHSSRGFTLVDTAILVLVSSLILGLLLDMLKVKVQQDNREETRQKVEAINEQIQEFLSDEQRYPCAARLTDLPDQTQFGTEVLSPNPTILGCGTAAPSGTLNTTGPAPALRTIRIGMVPVRTLNLPDDYAFDAWGNRILYAITVVQSRSGIYQPGNGALNIIDRNGVNLMTPPNTLDYVVLAPGAMNQGHYSLSGQVSGTCAGGNTLERENCNMNAVFRSAIHLTMDDPAQDFDDIIAYPKDTPSGEDGIPKGTRLPFNRGGISNCPLGWIRENPQPTGTFLYCKKI